MYMLRKYGMWFLIGLIVMCLVGATLILFGSGNSQTGGLLVGLGLAGLFVAGLIGPEGLEDGL